MLCVHSSIRFDFYAADDYSMQQSGNLSTTSLVEKCVMFKTLNDDLEEGNEVFTISLSIKAILPSTGNALLVNDVVQITILDAFDPPTVMGEGTYMYVYTYVYICIIGMHIVLHYLCTNSSSLTDIRSCVYHFL